MPLPEVTPPPLADGVDQALERVVMLFGRQAYYGCHEVLEQLWLAEPGGEREFFRGLLQVAVGLHHAGNGNMRGGQALLTEGLQRLEPFGPAHRGLDLGILRSGAQDALGALRSGQADFAPPTLRRIS